MAKNALFTLVSIEGTTPELHATGCRDLKGFAENMTVAASAADAIAQLIADGKLTADTKVTVMPCTNPVRMAAIGRLFDVPDSEPVAEPAVEETPAPVAEETPKLSKKARKAAKKAAKVAEEAAVA